MRVIPGWIPGTMIWFALIIGITGLLWRLIEYARTPQPHHIPLTPAPRTSMGVALRMTREIVLFSTLYRSDRLLWCLAWPFHAALLVLFLHHGQYMGLPGFTLVVDGFASWGAWTLLVTVTGLLLRRILLSRVRYVSAPSDYLMLLLFIVIGGLGIAMNMGHMPDLGGLHLFLRGTWRFDFVPLQAHAVLLAHLGGALLLLLLFPFSKLLHAPAVFFSPTLNQAER